MCTAPQQSYPVFMFFPFLMYSSVLTKELKDIRAGQEDWVSHTLVPDPAPRENLTSIKGRKIIHLPGHSASAMGPHPYPFWGPAMYSFTNQFPNPFSDPYRKIHIQIHIQIHIYIHLSGISGAKVYSGWASSGIPFIARFAR